MANNVEYVRLAKKFANFDNIDSLNSAVRQHLYNHKHELTPSSITVLKLLARHAAKYKGVAFLKINTIAELTDLSRSTVIRALKLLDETGIVLKRHVIRPKSGGNGANIYVIQKYRKQSETPQVEPREETETVTETSPETEKTDTETSISLKQEIFSNLRMPTQSLTPYQRFKRLIECYQSDKKVVYKIYGIFLAQIKYLRNCYDFDELLGVGLLAVKTTFNSVKKKRVKSLTGYYSGTLSNLLTNLYYAYLTEEGAY